MRSETEQLKGREWSKREGFVAGGRGESRLAFDPRSRLRRRLPDFWCKGKVSLYQLVRNLGLADHELVRRRVLVMQALLAATAGNADVMHG